jgi:gas vesicle protein
MAMNLLVSMGARCCMLEARNKERRPNMEENKATYFLLGLGLGVAAGMLLAPKSGEETRNLIRSKAGEGKEYLRRRTEELAESATEVVDKGKAAVSRQKDQIAAAMEAGKQAYREATSGPERGPAGTENF